MKKISRKGFLKVAAAAAMSGVTASALAACNAGSSSSTAASAGEAIYTPGTYTGTATGIGEVKVTMTFSETAITDVVIDASNETESIGGAALEELSKQVVAANGPAIDGVAGATVTAKAVRKAVADPLGVELAEEAPADSAAAAPAEPAAIVPVEGGIQIGQAYAAAHGTKCFTSGAVATAGDTIVLSYIDEFQFAGSDAGVDGVPNSDAGLGAGYAEGKVLMSKRVNADYYSKMMAEKAGSTVSLDANYDAIQNHVNGMSIADAEALSKDEKAVDAVSGATLVDTAGYVGVLVDAAK